MLGGEYGLYVRILFLLWDPFSIQKISDYFGIPYIYY